MQAKLNAMQTDLL